MRGEVMSAYDDFRTAWQTEKPFALDHVAQRLAQYGTSKNTLYDALERLLLEERAIGANDETEERILGVMDRLTGWCDPANRIATDSSHFQNGKLNSLQPVAAAFTEIA